MPWQPTQSKSYIKCFGTSSFPVLISTNAGNGYLKPINNPEGKHILVCDWIGTNLAKLIGLPTFEPAILEITEIDEIYLKNGSVVVPGPSFITKEENGSSMGTQGSLVNIENIQDVPLIVVFDTWVRNCDRYTPNYRPDGSARENLDNLFISTVGASPGKGILKPIDHGHILTCGRQITTQIQHISQTQDPKIYGMFPFLREHVTIKQIGQSVDVLSKLSSAKWQNILDAIPEAWEISAEVKSAIDRFLSSRASFLIRNMHDIFQNYVEQIRQ